MQKRVVLEIISTGLVEAPVVKDGNVIVDDSYISELLTAANKNMEKNKERINRLFRKLER
ncbi:unnamed protein product [marine sediment metagenome]|uniref:tRNA wybutosine-synthesizing protein domain-containing protein n=1 Tax=marine sediment metagenome TaxID=412755 RepID=X1SG91_9ZZZZ